jgi:hypothetical protein
MGPENGNQKVARRRWYGRQDPNAAVQNPRRRATSAPRTSPGKNNQYLYPIQNRGEWKLTVGVSIVGSASSRTMVPDTVADDTPESHVDDPDDERDEGREGCTQGHEDCAYTAESSSTESE